jgi:hypothetical protein
MTHCRELNAVEILVTWINIELLQDPIARSHSLDQQDCSMRSRVYFWLNKQRDGMIMHLTTQQRRRITLRFETKIQQRWDRRDGERTLRSKLYGRSNTIIEE